MSSKRVLAWEEAPWEPAELPVPRPLPPGGPRPAAFIYPAAREELRPSRAPAMTPAPEAPGASRAAGAEGAAAGDDRAAAAPEMAIFERGREQGRAEARAEAEAELRERWRGQAAADIAAERAAIGMVVGAFARARAGYFVQVEGEVVRLALSIARRILHREAQVDPLLLRGAVRLALERLDQNTQVTLRVPPRRAAAWRQAFAAPRGLPPEMQAPTVVEDATLDAEACVLATALGETRSSVEEQLREIEQGFFDLIAERGELAGAAEPGGGNAAGGGAAPSPSSGEAGVPPAGPA